MSFFAHLQLYPTSSQLNTNQHGRPVRRAASGRARSNEKAPPRRTNRTASPPPGPRSQAPPKSARYRIRPSRNSPRPTAHPPTPTTADPSRRNFTHRHARGPRSARLRLGHRTRTPANTAHPARPCAPAAGFQAALWPATPATSPHARAHAIYTAPQPPNIERLSRALSAPHPAPAHSVSEREAPCEPYGSGIHPVRRATPRA